MCSICDVNTVSNGHHDPSMVSCNRRERLIMMIDNDRKNYVECSPGELYKDVFIGLCGSSVHLMWIECPLEVNRVSIGSESSIHWKWIECPLVHVNRMSIGSESSIHWIWIECPVDVDRVSIGPYGSSVHCWSIYHDHGGGSQNDRLGSITRIFSLYIALISIYIYLYIALSAVIRII